MRALVVASALSALVLASIGVASDPATAAKTKMGCERGKQVWNATLGQCVAGKSKYAGMSARRGAKKATKAPAKKAAPAK